MKVSFCITCMGRTSFLRQVLAENIERNPQAEFILVDYDSKDGLEAWLKADMWHHVESGALTIYRVENLRYFVHAHAKNIAHRMASGDILCNLDADNMAASGFTQFLIDTFKGNQNVYARPSSGGGRIAMTRENFMRFGGYDEGLAFGWGWEDNDLVDRVGHALAWHDIPPTFNWRKEHDNDLRVEFTATTNMRTSNEVHRLMSVYRIDNGHYVANVGRQWGWWPKLVKNYSEYCFVK